MILSLFTIAAGAALYARFSGNSTTHTGLVWILVNCVVSVIHRVLERYMLTSDMKLSFEAMTLINNVIPLVPVGALAWATGEVQQWPEYAHLMREPMALAVLACSGIVGLCLGQSSIILQKCVTATTMMTLQTTNKLVIIVAAMFIFSDRFTPKSLLGCMLSLLGCAAYGVAQRAASQASDEHKSPLPTVVKKWLVWYQ
jgi:drug/metabolite transporter (DMT)-like permease